MHTDLEVESFSGDFVNIFRIRSIIHPLTRWVSALSFSNFEAPIGNTSARE